MNLGGSFGLAAAQAAFANRIISTIATSAPAVNAQQLIYTGATDIRKAFPADQLPGILIAYMAGIKVVFAIGIGMVGGSFLMSLLNSRKRLHGESKSAVMNV